MRIEVFRFGTGWRSFSFLNFMRNVNKYDKTQL